MDRQQQGRQRFSLLAVGVTFAMFLTSCGATPSPSASGSSGAGALPTGRAATLVIAKDTSTDVTMDPARALDDLYYPLFHAVYQGLVEWQFTPGKGYDYTKLVGELAQSWTVSADAKTYTFKLRPEARFSTGNPVTSADVQFSLERLKNVKGNPSYLVAGIDSVETPDPETAIIHLSAPDATFVGRMTYSNFAIYDSKVVKQNGGTDDPNADKTDKAEAFLSAQSVGSGPFKMTKHVPGGDTVLERVNPWWGGAPAYLEKVVITNIPDQSAQVEALKRGDIDMTWRLPPALLKDAEQAGFKPLTTTIFNWFELVLTSDPSNSPFVANPLVQRALKLAINYKDLANLCPGSSSGFNGVTPDGLRGGLAPTAQLAQDVTQAKALLAQAGYPNGYGNGPGQQPVKLTAPNNINFGFCPAHADVAQKIAADWGSIGVKTDVTVSDFGLWVTPFRAGKFQATIGDWYPDFPDALNFEQAMLPGNALDIRGRWGKFQSNSSGYKELASLQAQAIGETDPAKRLQLVGMIEALIVQDSPIVPLLQIDQFHAMRSELQGVYPHSIAQFDITHITHGPR